MTAKVVWMIWLPAWAPSQYTKAPLLLAVAAMAEAEWHLLVVKARDRPLLRLGSKEPGSIRMVARECHRILRQAATLRKALSMALVVVTGMRCRHHMKMETSWLGMVVQQTAVAVELFEVLVAAPLVAEALEHEAFSQSWH